MSFAVYFIIIEFSQVSRSYFVCINAACVYRLRSLTSFFFFHGVLHLIHKILFYFNVYHYFWGFFPQNHKNNSHCWNYTSTALMSQFENCTCFITIPVLTWNPRNVVLWMWDTYIKRDQEDKVSHRKYTFNFLGFWNSSKKSNRTFGME